MVPGNSAHTGTAWADWQSELDANPYLFLSNHSYSHPSTATGMDYYEQYVDSRTLMMDNLDMGWQYQYKGNQYQTAFMQFGGCVGIDGAEVKWMISTNDFLCLAIGRGYEGQDEVSQWFNYYDFDYPAWDSTYDIFYNSGLGIPFIWVITYEEDEAGGGSLLTDDPYVLFDTVWTNGGVWEMYDHAWQDAAYLALPENSNGVAFLEYIGNRHDVWYTHEEGKTLYNYLSNHAPPAISITKSNAVELIFNVDGSALDRDAYGLSFPLSFVVDKPVGIASGDDYSVSYSTNGVLWAACTQKTANDWYNDLNCYRDDGDQVIVNQGLPHFTDSFQIRIHSNRMIPAFFRGGD